MCLSIKVIKELCEENSKLPTPLSEFRSVFQCSLLLLPKARMHIYFTECFSCLRNRLPVGGGCVYVLFCRCFFFVFCFFLFFPVRQKYETTVLGNGWTDFHETFTKRYRGKCSLKRPAAAWRMANVDDSRNLRYDSGGITRGRHTRRLHYTTMSGRMHVI